MLRARFQLVLLIVVASASGARAADAFGTALGRLYLSFDPVTRSGELDLDQFRPFSFYLVADVDFATVDRPELNELSGVAAWEAGVRIPPQLIILERGVPSSCCGSECLQKKDHLDNWIVQLCSATAGLGRPVVLVQYLAMLGSLAVEDLRVGIAAPSPSRLGQEGLGAGPGWQELVASGECANEPCWRAFDDWSGNDLIINPTGVSVVPESFSGLKARY